MEELGMPREHKLVSASMYEKVICCVHMGDEISDFFNRTLLLSKDAHSHQLYLVYAVMMENK